MMGQLVARGHELTPHPDQADVLVVNTCSFIDPAKKESVDTILEMAEYKKIGRAKKLIVAGCLVERYRGDIRTEHARSRRPDRHQRTGTASSPSAKAWSPPANPLEPYLYHDLTPRVLATPAPLRLHQDRRRLRPSLHLLRDPAVPRRLPQPPLRIRDLRSHAPLPAGRPRDQPDRPGHHLLRRGSRPQGRPGRTCSPAWRRSKRRTKSGSASSTPTPTRSRRNCSTPSPSTPSLVKYIDMPLQHASADVLKRMKRGASRRHLPQADRAHPPHHSRRRHPHQLHRRLPRRDRRRFRRALPVRRGRPVRSPGRVHLLRRRHQRQLSRSTARWTAAPFRTASAA